MTEDSKNRMGQQSISTKTARYLATTTKTAPQMAKITPRYLLKLLPWVHVEAGIYRVNRRKIILKEDFNVSFFEENGDYKVKADSLRSIPFFAEVDDSTLEYIASQFVSEYYDAGQVVVEESDEHDKFYVIAQGIVEVSTVGNHGKKLNLSIMADGDYFGENALFGDSYYLATVKTRTKCVLLAIEPSKYKNLLDDSTELRENYMRALEKYNEAKEAVNEYGESKIGMEAGHEGEVSLPETFVDYADDPREYHLSTVQTILRMHTRVSDLYNNPLNQLREQMRLTIEGMKERQEWEIINNKEFGLLNNVAPAMRVQTRNGPPTPDDLDELISRVWKKPSFFLAHPRAIAAFGRECTRRGVPPQTTTIFGSPLISWRGIPIIPCDKLAVESSSAKQSSTVGPLDGNKLITGLQSGKTSILLMRVGEKEQGVVGLHQTGIPGEQLPGLSVNLMGINNKAVASYLLSLYFSAAVLTDDALGKLENVEVGYYHDYE